MPTLLTPVAFNDQISSTQRLKALESVDKWLAANSPSHLKKMIMHAVMKYAHEELISIKKNILGQRLVDSSRFYICHQILNAVDKPDLDFLLIVGNQIKIITNSHSGLREVLSPLIYFTGNKSQTGFILNKIERFKSSLLPLQLTDFFATFVGFVSVAGLSMLTNPFIGAAVSLVGEITYAYSQRRRQLSQAEQDDLTELYKVYQWCTASGAVSTYFPCVIKLAQILAPYVSTKKLIPWDKELKSNHREEDPQFILLLQQPPHNLIMNKQISLANHDEYAQASMSSNLQKELRMKQQKIKSHYGFWKTNSAEMIRAMYGLSEDDHQPSRPVRTNGMKS